MKKRLVLFLVIGIGVLFFAYFLQTGDRGVVEDVPLVDVVDNEEIVNLPEDELREKEVLENPEGKFPVIKVKYGLSDSLIVRLNSKVIFDSKTNPSAGSFEIETTADFFAPVNNSLEIEYVEVVDDVVSSLEVFATEDAKENDLNWEAAEGSGKVSFPISYFSVL